jgi:transcriptional regulator with XRE-family HTH domain
MAGTSSSSVLHARQQIADRLREVRLDADLTLRAVAAAAGWHESKSSRIERALTRPSDADIRAWCRACGAADQAVDLIAASRAADSMWTQWRRLERPGLRRAQESVIPLWEATRAFRIYSPCLIPSPLQSEVYVRALLAAVRDRRPNLVDDIEQAVAVRLARQQVVYEPDHEFVILLEENVLRHRIGGSPALREQLEHLLRAAMTVPSVQLGIIPFAADRSLLRPVEMFFMFDDTEVQAELVSGWLRVTQPTEIGMYGQAFSRLSQMAVYGQKARALIGRALHELD